MQLLTQPLRFSLANACVVEKITISYIMFKVQYNKRLH